MLHNFIGFFFNTTAYQLGQYNHHLLLLKSSLPTQLRNVLIICKSAYDYYTLRTYFITLILYICHIQHISPYICIYGDIYLYICIQVYLPYTTYICISPWFSFELCQSVKGGLILSGVSIL